MDGSMEQCVVTPVVWGGFERKVTPKHTHPVSHTHAHKETQGKQTQTHINWQREGGVAYSLHHCSTMRSRTRFTFRSESRPKSVSMNGAAGGVRGRKPDVSDSSQSAGSKVATSRLFLEVTLGGGVVQMGGGGGGRGAGATGKVLDGEGGSSSSREEHRGDDRKFSSLDWLCGACDWSDWAGGEDPARKLTGDWISVPGEASSE